MYVFGVTMHNMTDVLRIITISDSGDLMILDR